MPLYRIEVECQNEEELETVIADGRWQVKEVKNKKVLSKPVCFVTVEDRDAKDPVVLEIRKLETGEFIGLDGNYLDRLDGDPSEDGPTNPYESDTMIVVPDNERESLRNYDLTKWPFTLDSAEFDDMMENMRRFGMPSDE